MPHRLQITYNSGGVIEVMLGVDGQARSLHINPIGLPWNLDAFQDPDLRAALHNYMMSSNAEGWIGWPELEGVLRAGLVDVEALTERHPATR